MSDSAADRLDDIEIRMIHPNTTYKENVTEDMPRLVAALRAVLDEIDKRKHTTGGCLTLADVLPTRIEEALQ